MQVRFAVSTVPNIAEELATVSRKSGFYFTREKMVSLLHRIKVKEDPRQEMTKYFEKFGELNNEMKELIEEIDLKNIAKSKHGGRGADKGARKPKGYESYYSQTKRENYEKMMNHDGSPDSAWMTPPNM